MADIDVVKKGSNTWLFILIGLVVLALILWFVMAGNEAPQTGLLLHDGTAPWGAVTAPRA